MSVSAESPAPATTPQVDALREVSPKRAVGVILAVSLAAFLLLIGVIYGHGPVQAPPAWVGYLPAVNATLNGTSAVFLVLAFRAIKKRDLALHSRHTLTAMGASALFLVSYLVYHSVHGDSKFPDALKAFLKLPLSDESKQKILWDNWVKMYGIDVDA